MQTQMAAQQQQQQQNAVAKVDPRQMDLKRLLEGSKAALSQVVPRHLTPDRLIKVALMATSKSPDLLKCSAQSILQSVMQAAELGLEVNSPLGQAYLVAFNNKIKEKDDDGRERERWVMECQLIIGYRGFIDLAKRSGEIATVEARCVYANDFFEVIYGTDQRLTHRPSLKDPGPLVCVWAMARIKGSDAVIFDVLTLGDVDYARSVSKTGAKGYGPWRDRYDEMARKTAVRRLAKYLPLSPELANAMDIDDRDSELQVAPIEVDEPLTDKLSKRAAASRKPETVTIQSAPSSDLPTTPESDGARFCRLLTAAQDVATLDRIMDDARATLKGADLHRAEQYAIDRRVALAA